MYLFVDKGYGAKKLHVEKSITHQMVSRKMRIG